MPTKSKTSKSTKSRVSSKAKKTTDKKLFIALGVLVIAIVAVVGILWYRDSQAAGARIYGTWNTTVQNVFNTGPTNRTEAFSSGSKRFVRAGRFNSGVIKWIHGGSGCAVVFRQGSKWASTNEPSFRNGEKIVVGWTDNCQ